MKKSKTSTAVKARWNRAHYDTVQFTVAKGTKEIVDNLAKQLGMSRAEYIRHLIIADAKKRENVDISALIGGGANLENI